MLIALALACEPALLIADEPTTALDVMVQAQVLRLLAELQRDQGLAMLFITHDLSLLTSTCRRLAIMYAGRIVEEGPSDEVFVDGSAPVQPGAGPRLPADRRSGVADGAERSARRSAEPRRPARRMPVRPRCDVAIDECQIERRQAASRRRVAAGRACVHVGTADG